MPRNLTGRRVRLGDIRRSETTGSEAFVYATVRDAVTDELILSATLDYCLTAIAQRGYAMVEPTFPAGSSQMVRK